MTMTTPALTVNQVPPHDGLMPFGRAVGAYIAEARYECIRMMRTPAFAIPFLLIPVGLYLFFAFVLSSSPASGADTPRVAYYIFTAFGIIGVMGPGLFGFGMSIAVEREQGLLRLKRALPMPPTAYLLAKMVMAMVFSLIVAVGILLIGVVGKGLPLTAAQMANLLLIETLGTLPFCAMGLFIGARVSGKAAPAVVNMVYLPMIYLSGLFFPLPGALRIVPVFSPAFHLNQAAQVALGFPSALGPNGMNMHIAMLAGVTVLFTMLTVRRVLDTN